nr:hypothetical protein BaRGS_032511 [Batillaria attramentaria]
MYEIVFPNDKGNEQHIVDCGITQDDWAHHNCPTHARDAGVDCTVGNSNNHSNNHNNNTSITTTIITTNKNNKPIITTNKNNKPIHPAENTNDINHTSKLDDTLDNFLVFTDSYSGLLIRMDLRTYSFTGIQLPGSPNPVALDFNPADRRLYYSEVVVNPGSQIYSAGIDAGQPKLLKQLPQGSIVDGLAVDSGMQKVFYTDAGRDVIASMNLDGSGEQVLISGQLDQPRAIVLDDQNK